MHRRARHLNARHAGAGLVLDARRLTGLNDGDAVSTWADKSGNSWDATGTSTARPLYKTAIQGGQPVLRFDGANDYLALTSGALDLVRNRSYFRLLTVYSDRNAVNTGDRSVFFATTSSTVSSRARLIQTYSSQYSVYAGGRAVDGESYAQSVSGYGSLSSFNVISGNFSYILGLLSVSKNGIQAATTALPSSSNSSNTASNNINIASSYGTANFMPCDIGLMLGVVSYLSAPLIRRLEHSAAFSFKIQCS